MAARAAQGLAELAALTTQGAALLLFQSRHAHHGQRFFLSGRIAAQLAAQGPGVIAIIVDLAPIGVQAGGHHHQGLHAQGRQLPMQPKAGRAGFVTAPDFFGQPQLLASELREGLRREGLRRLRGQIAHLTDHFELGGVNIHGQLDAGKLPSWRRSAGHGLPTGLRGLFSSNHTVGG